MRPAHRVVSCVTAAQRVVARGRDQAPRYHDSDEASLLRCLFITAAQLAGPGGRPFRSRTVTHASQYHDSDEASLLCCLVYHSGGADGARGQVL